MVRLIFLGRFGDIAPADLADVTLPDDVKTLSDLWAWLGRMHPVLGHAMTATSTRLVVNQTVAHDLSLKVWDGDEIAFMPPMSGG
jgi:molybdopterin converting factor small subunit